MKKICDSCEGKGYTYVKIGDKTYKTPCSCTEEGKRIEDNKKRINDELERRRKDSGLIDPLPYFN